MAGPGAQGDGEGDRGGEEGGVRVRGLKDSK